MVYIVTTAWYPSHKAMEVGKRFLELLKKYPPGSGPGESIVPVSVITTKTGIKVMTIREVKDDQAQEFSEALTYVGTNMAEYLDIEGFEYKTRTWASVESAMETLGLKMP